MTLPGARIARSSPDASTDVLVPHPPEWPVYEEETIQCVTRMLRRGRSFDYGYGDELAALEETFREYHGRAYALALNSGTSALLAAFFAVGVAEPDEVVCPVFTFFSSATPLLMLGGVPVLADAAARTGNVSAKELVSVTTERTAAWVVTHLWGNPCPMDDILSEAQARRIALIEDCSHAHGALYRDRPVGSLADISVFSIGGHKAVSGGLGGMLLTDDPDLYARACLFANFRHRTDLTIDSGAYAPFLQTGLGGNLRISPTAAVLALEHLNNLDTLVARRQENVGQLIGALTQLPGIRAVPLEPGCTTGAWYDGPVEISADSPIDRDTLVRQLQQRGLKVRTPATRPLHHYELFRGSAPEWSPRMARAALTSARINDRRFPQADYLFDHWIRLPVNFLYEERSSLPEHYAEAFAEVFGNG
ncbi:DegT/DnrJ/EryC1/StrS family aminotransferase [Streptomyces sp. NPDC050164]|uniref:DegT/DnrJ/EryC1/StrS family aminotransferase n=1 Tax=Streptomyces sp. NPDC050164 TaxID=3365605 RepID=UPI0037BC3C08